MRPGTGSTVQRYDPPTSNKSVNTVDDITAESQDSERRPVANRRRSECDDYSGGGQEGDVVSGLDSDDSCESAEHRNRQNAVVPGRTPTRNISSSPVDMRSHNESLNVQIRRILKSTFDYSQSAWVFFLMTLLMIGVQVPFNSIHAGFLQMRWYHNNPQKGNNTKKKALKLIPATTNAWSYAIISSAYPFPNSILFFTLFVFVPHLLISNIIFFYVRMY